MRSQFNFMVSNYSQVTFVPTQNFKQAHSELLSLHLPTVPFDRTFLLLPLTSQNVQNNIVCVPRCIGYISCILQWGICYTWQNGWYNV